ncbi:hypothetical protein PR001_g25280 [Phytophthora rubi]|uniref:Secreted protein n=1 Tax=Phytophthora rubi TaxID=129364 RepID=A0A6A3I5B6_9STRA|nr:hypothetical protein PR001_g25280 [Phytophthora rubi]
MVIRVVLLIIQGVQGVIHPDATSFVVIRLHSLLHSNLGTLLHLGLEKGGLHLGCDGCDSSGLLRCHSG